MVNQTLESCWEIEENKESIIKTDKVVFLKEFFKVDLDELENKILDICNNAKFIKDVEATEYNETLKILNKIKEDKKSRPGSL